MSKRTLPFMGKNRTLACVQTLSILVIMGWATTKLAAQDLPSGESVLENHIEATGGQEAYDKIQNRVSKGKMEIVNAGIELSLTVYAAKPNKALVILESEALGKIQQGIDGKVAWSLSDLQGPIVEQGAAREHRLRDSWFDRFAYWKDIFQSAECTGIEQIDGNDCFKVVFEPKPLEGEGLEQSEPNPMTVFFDQNSYLPLKVETRVVSEAGTVDVTVMPSDFKEVDGVKLPHTMKTQLMGQQRVLTTTSVEHNVKLPPDLFDPPAEIKALLEKEQ